MIKEFQGEYRWLSNFAPVYVVMDDAWYTTVEGAYQASKTLDKAERVIFEEATPAQAKKFGRKVTLRPDWDQVKLEIMEDLTRKKYQDLYYREKLKATGDQQIIEGNYWGDTFWGVCRGVGHNHLGQIIMKIRAEIS